MYSIVILSLFVFFALALTFQRFSFKHCLQVVYERNFTRGYEDQHLAPLHFLGHWSKLV